MLKSKKFRLISMVIVVLVALAGGGFYFANKSQKTNDTPQPTSSGTSRSSEANPAPPSPEKTPVDACEKFTLEDAQKLIGDNAQIVNSEDSKPRETEDIRITTCAYQAGGGSNAKSTSLLVRVAKTPEGSSQDKAQFGPNRPSNAVDIADFGDTGYWNTDFGELHILKGSNWYIMTAGPQNASERKMEDAVSMAKLLDNKL
jgi:hypothetical protein